MTGRQGTKTAGGVVRWVHRIVALGLIGLASVLLSSAAPAQADGEVIAGTLSTQSGKAVENVKVTAADKQKPTVTVSATSDADGRFQLAVPGPSTYVVKLDTTTLPKGIKLDQGVPDSREVTVSPGQRAGASFNLTDGAASTNSGIQNSVFAQRLVEGIRFGLIIAITAIGLSLIFGTTGLTNFSHGELVTVGAFAAWWLNTSMGVPLILSTLFAIVVGVVLGALNDLLIWRPLRKRRTGLVAMLVISIGLSLVLRYLLLLAVGGDRQFYDTPTQTAMDLGVVSITPRDLEAMGMCLAILLGVALMLQYTRMGKAMRAVSDNRDLAAASGINVNRVILLVWMLGGGLAAFGGVMYGWTLNLRFDMGFTLLLLMFAGVTLGGLGTAYGALLGSVVIGVIVQLSTMVIPDDIKTVSGLLILILILLVRPSGILGARQRIG
jgi:branched-chain amino acid transport system permease protein